MTRGPSRFPDCKQDPKAIRHSSAAGAAGAIVLHAVPPGRYAPPRIHPQDTHASPGDSARPAAAAAAAGALARPAVPPVSYALSVIHDENNNGRLDTFARIPREGFG